MAFYRLISCVRFPASSAFSCIECVFLHRARFHASSAFAASSAFPASSAFSCIERVFMHRARFHASNAFSCTENPYVNVRRKMPMVNAKFLAVNVWGICLVVEIGILGNNF